MGLYVPEEYGGQGLSQTGYARVFEAIGQVHGSLTIGLGVHQSIGFKGIALYGTDEQKERFLPDLAAGRKLAGFALTEPNAGLRRLQHRERARCSSPTARGCSTARSASSATAAAATCSRRSRAPRSTARTATSR